MNKFTLEAKVGALFLAGLVIFAYVWFKILDFNLKEGFILTARFKSVEGLVKDAQVQMAGIKIGKVKDIQYDTDTGKAVVILEINDVYKNSIPEGSKISLKTKGILGDKYVVIEPGKPNARKLKPGEELQLVFEPTDTEKVFETMGVVAGDLQALTKEARRQIIDEKGSEKVDQIINNSDTVMRELRDLLTRNRDKINNTVDNTQTAAADLSEITGKNKDKLHRTIDELEKFSKNMDKTSDKFGRVANELESLTKDVRGGRGTIGKLVTDESLYREGQALIRDFRNVANSVQYGRGTISRIINDPEMYIEARRTVRNLNKAAEDISDQTPISTLANILGAVLK